ncbi:MAG: DUF1684 domain-containing protein [Acidobacteria bacterium]|nr:DUF1684 domain-containing protein [Acidobacteriota bacterium]
MKRTLVSLLAVIVLLPLPAAMSGQSQPGKPADPAAAILAAHRKIDDSYKRASMSPFTAVAVRYFEPGQTVRLRVGPSSAAFEPADATPDGVDVTLQDGAFWFTPVAGSVSPAVLGKTPGGDDAVEPALPVTSRLRVSDKQVIRLGRYFIEPLARLDSGNVRVFDPDSAARSAFAGLKWYPPNLALQVEAAFTPNPSPDKIIMATSRGLKKEYYRVGTLAFAVEGTPQKLTVLAMSASPKAGDELFVPFRDATTGAETYEVGRYLMFPFQTDRAYEIDFNGATNPLCNYSPHYNCPIPPRDNVLTVAIRAGEMAYPKPH